MDIAASVTRQQCAVWRRNTMAAGSTRPTQRAEGVAMTSGSVIVEATQVFAAEVTISFFGLWTISAGGAWAVVGWIFLVLMGLSAVGALIQGPSR